MKITFLEPCDYSFYHAKMGGPLGLAYIASYIENHIDEKFQFSVQVNVDQAIKTKPDIIAISSYTQNFIKAVSAAEKIKKESGIPVIIGGKHITALPSSLKNCFDAGIAGDGELSMTELIQTYMDKKGFFPEELVKIPGVIFRDGNKVHVNEPREPLRELDILPKPKRDIMRTFWPGDKEEWFWPQGLYTSRGCPYKCPFCIHSKIKFVTRYHSPQRVVSEIQDIVLNYPNQKHINIHDDLFTISKKRLREIVDLIVEEKLNKKVSFSCMCKSNLFDDEIAEMLREMNVRFIAFGFESGDEKTLQYLKKDSSKIHENISAINSCEKYGILSCGYFILGAPPETKEGMNKTYWFIRNNLPPMSVAGAFCLSPFPGTKTWDYALEKGIVNPEKENWDKYNYINYEYTSELFINENYSFDFFKNAFKNYFMDLNKKNNVFLNNDNPELEKKLYSEIFQSLKKYNLKYEDNILEIGTNFLPDIKNLFEGDKQITKFDHWIYLSDKNKCNEYEETKLKNQEFDIIFFNNSLEQMINPYKKLNTFTKNHLKVNGKAIILIKNPQFIDKISNILLNRWDSNISGFRKFDDFYNINISEMKTFLEKNGLKIIDEIKIKSDVHSFSETYRILAKAFNNVDFLADSDKMYFLLVAQKVKGDD